VRFVALAAAWAVLLAAGAATSLRAQQAELQVGAIGAWGAKDAYKGGVGGSLAILGGRVLYLGGTFVYYFGTTAQDTSGAAPMDVEVRSSLLTGDLGFQLPAGPFELLATVSFGAVKFRETVAPVGGLDTTEARKKAEFVFAPGLVATLPVGPFRLAAGAQYYFAGDPGFGDEFKSNSLVLTLRLILAVPIKVYPVAL
jgi:hypothetical protein